MEVDGGEDGVVVDGDREGGWIFLPWEFHDECALLADAGEDDGVLAFRERAFFDVDRRAFGDGAVLGDEI